jgi:hypothetical protein
MIYTFIPYKDGDEDFRDTCNRFMSLLPGDDDFGIVIDHDAMFTTLTWNQQIQDAIKRYPKVNAFAAVTNRIYAPCLWADVDRDTNDVGYHRQRGEEIANELWDEAFEMPPVDSLNRGWGGFFMMLRKRTWREIGGFAYHDEDGKFGGMDWSTHARLIRHGEKVYALKGVYVYHWYSNFNPERYADGERRDTRHDIDLFKERW